MHTNNNIGDYNKIRIEGARVCHTKKKEVLKIRTIRNSRTTQQKWIYQILQKNIQNRMQEFRPRLCACKNKNGKILTDDEKVLSWKKYFENILLMYLYSTVACWCIQACRRYFCSCQNLKIFLLPLKTYCMLLSPWNPTDFQEPMTTAEVLKCTDEDLWKSICNLITLNCGQLKIPNDWLMGIIQPICNKGDKLECSNYRPMMLLIKLVIKFYQL